MNLKISFSYDTDREPVVVSSADELDKLLDEAQQLSIETAQPILALHVVGAGSRPGHAALDVAANRDLGSLLYNAPKEGKGPREAWESHGDRDGEPVTYVHDQGRHWADQYADTEIPYERVKAAVHEFMTTGEQPTCIQWIPLRAGLDGA